MRVADQEIRRGSMVCCREVRDEGMDPRRPASFAAAPRRAPSRPRSPAAGVRQACSDPRDRGRQEGDPARSRHEENERSRGSFPHRSPPSTELPYSLQPRGSRPRRGWARGGAEILSTPPRLAWMCRARAGGRGGGMQGGRDGGPALAHRRPPLLPPVREGGASPRRSRTVNPRDPTRSATLE
jgi:hypothetical protein